MIVAAGRLCAQKNLTTLIRAMRLLSCSPPAILFLCGVGSDGAWLRRLAADEGVERCVRFPGFVSAIWSWLKRADVFVSVSLFEGQPNAVLEAMAAGCPTVLSDIPAHRELLGDQETLFVDPASPASVALGLARSLDDRGAALERAALAEGRIGERSADEIACRYRGVYEAILAKEPPMRRGAPEPRCAG
jgi:glycosyltransferase involved in cell wall biosynthesis